MKKLLTTLCLTVLFSMSAQANRGAINDHIGAYNWRVTVDNINGSIELPEPVEADVPVFDSYDDRSKTCELKVCVELPETLSVTLPGIQYSTDPEALITLKKALAEGSISLELVDGKNKSIQYRGDFRGRIKRVRIRKRLSVMPGLPGPSFETIEFEVVPSKGL